VLPATGRAPRGLYAALRAHARDGSLPSEHITVLGRDEYLGLAGDDPASFQGEQKPRAEQVKEERYLEATTRPARHPGARPPLGGWIDAACSPLRAITQAITEFEFHISPVPSSSRPHTGVGTFGTTSSTRRARPRRR
jgi:hypothetical protein